MIVTMAPDACYARGESRHCLQALQDGRALSHELMRLGTQRLLKPVSLRREHLQDLLGVAAQVSGKRTEISSAHAFRSKGGIRRALRQCQMQGGGALTQIFSRYQIGPH